MKLCPNCKAENRDSARYCVSCGIGEMLSRYKNGAFQEDTSPSSDPATRDPDSWNSLRDITVKAISTEPEDRFQSAEEMEHELKNRQDELLELD